MCCPDVVGRFPGSRDVPHNPLPITNSATPYRAAQPFRGGGRRSSRIMHHSLCSGVRSPIQGITASPLEEPTVRGRCKDPYDLSPHLPTVASQSPRTPLKRSHRPFYPEFEVDQGPTRPGRVVYYAESTCLEYTALSAQADSALWHHRPVA